MIVGKDIEYKLVEILDTSGKEKLEKAVWTLALTQLEQHVQVKTAELEFLHAEVSEGNWIPEVEKIIVGAKNAFE